MLRPGTDLLQVCEQAALRRARACPACGDKLVAELFEAWLPREFMVDACCEAMQESLLQALQDGGTRSRAVLLAMQADALLGEPLRGAVEDNGRLVLDFEPRVQRIAFGPAAAFISLHHEHCRPPPGWRFGLGAWNGCELVGVTMVGRPVSRILAADPKVLEVTRLCTDRRLGDALRRNLVSMLLGRAARQARELGARRLITYTLQSESGASLRASGFRPESLSRGGRWARPSRPRADGPELGPKRRWARELAPPGRAHGPVAKPAPASGAATRKAACALAQKVPPA